MQIAKKDTNTFLGQSSNMRITNRLYWPAALCGIGLLIFLGVYRQPYFATPWFDEGLVLQGAINLVKYGQYAMRSVEGFRVLDQPLIANGPGIVLPVSTAFAFWGVGLLQARYVIVVYFVASAILFYWISSRLYNHGTAVLSILVLFAIPMDGFVMYGRQVLGNIPALAYFFVGCLFFIKLGDRKTISLALLSGLFLGLALLTKGQYWILVPVLGLVVLADWFYYKQIGLMNGIAIIAVICFCFVIWQIVQYFLVGAENYSQHLDAISASSKISVFAFRVIRIPGSIWYLIRSGFPFFILPGLIMVIWDCRHRDSLAVARFFLTVFVTGWTIWYVFASVGWSRYAFEAYSVGAIFSGVAILRAIRFIRSAEFARLPGSNRESLIKASLILFLAVTLIWGAWGLIGQIKLVLFHNDPAPHLLADYLREHVPSDAVIESWEWEIDALAPELTYHHPTNEWVDRKTAELQFGDVLDEKYDPAAFLPDYLIDGPFSKSTGIYNDFLADNCCFPVIAIGNYTLYEVRAHWPLKDQVQARVLYEKTCRLDLVFPWGYPEVKLSVIIPCYNEKATIHLIVDKAFALELPIESEIVIIDDCSTDGTQEYLWTLSARKTSGFVCTRRIAEKAQRYAPALPTHMEIFCSFMGFLRGNQIHKMLTGVLFDQFDSYKRILLTDKSACTQCL
jgi:hypothetical protein